MNVETYWGHTFLPDLIRPDGVAFDFGVNSGGLARLIAPRCRRVIGFEPDPTWHGKLVLPDNVDLRPLALAARRGTVELNVNPATCSSLHYGDPQGARIAVSSMTLEDALALAPAGRIELVKIDIEGEEVAVLNEAPQAALHRIAQLTVEFHDFLDPASLPGIRAAISRMRSLGFAAFKFSARSYGDMLFVNRALEPLSWADRAYLIAVHKYARGASRVLGRALHPSKTH